MLSTSFNITHVTYWQSFMFIHIAELSKSMLSAGISLLHVLPDTYTVVVHRFFSFPWLKKRTSRRIRSHAWTGFYYFVKCHMRTAGAYTRLFHFLQLCTKWKMSEREEEKRNGRNFHWCASHHVTKQTVRGWMDGTGGGEKGRNKPLDARLFSTFTTMVIFRWKNTQQRLN